VAARTKRVPAATSEQTAQSPAAPTSGGGAGLDRAAAKARRRRVCWFKALLFVGVLGALGIAGFVILGDLRPEEAAAGALVALAGLALALLALVPAEQLLSLSERVTSLSVGKFLDLQLVSPLFRSTAEGNDDATPDPDDPTDASSLGDLKRSLDMKIAYLAKHVLAPVPNDDQTNIPTFLNIGSLCHDKYLTADQAEMAYEVRGVRPAEFRALTASKQKQFLEDASKFVDTVRITVFAQQVFQELEQPDWTVRWVYPHGSTRPDMTVTRPAGAGDTHHVIPVFTEKKASSLFDRPRKRLGDEPRTAGEGRRFIVAPPLSKAATDAELLSSAPGPDGRVWVVTLRGLKQWLQTQSDPRNLIETAK
jgi:hypothetical protein